MSGSKRILAVAVVLVLLAIPLSAVRAEWEPLNYCTTVNAVQEAGLSTYEVNATGSGRYARLVEYPVTGAPVVVAGPRDFGSGATTYQFQHVTLDPAKRYQFQTSHTSLATGYSTTGCILNPPPLFNQIDAFTATCTPQGVLFAWEMMSEAGIFEYVLALDGNPPLILARIPSNCPGCMGPASYDYLHPQPANGLHWVFPTIGAASVVVDCPPGHPTAVRLSRFSAR